MLLFLRAHVGFSFVEAVRDRDRDRERDRSGAAVIVSCSTAGGCPATIQMRAPEHDLRKEEPVTQLSELEAAAARATSLPKQPNDVLLKLYGLYKQANNGDVSGDEPGMFDMVGRAKYQAWKKHRGMTQEEAIQAYVALVDKLAAE